MSDLKRKSVITGLPGWLANRLARRLLNEGFKIVALVREADSDRLPPDIASKIKVEIGDVANKESLKALFKEPADIVFHAAGVIHPKTTSSFYQVNSQGTKNMLEAAKDRAGRFIFVSSNAAAGFSDRLNRTMTEEDEPRPESPYGKSKLLAEEAVLAAHGQGLETVVLRPSMYIGEEQPERMTVLMKLVKQGRVPIFGSADKPRSFTPVENLVEAMIVAVAHKRAAGELFWIVSNRPYRTGEFLALLAKALKVELRIRRFPAWPAILAERLDLLTARLGIYNPTLHILGETTRAIAASGQKAEKLLGLRPKRTVEEAIERAVEWAEANGRLT